MRAFVTTLALAIAVAFAGVAFAAEGAPKSKAECEAAGGSWDAASNSCK
jgi:hypothetical protein